MKNHRNKLNLLRHSSNTPYPPFLIPILQLPLCSCNGIISSNRHFNKHLNAISIHIPLPPQAMVGRIASMAWFSASPTRSSTSSSSSASTTTTHHHYHSNSFSRFFLEKSPRETLQILSFQAAKTMSRLVALYRFLSDEEFSNLRNGSMKSTGVAYLTSTDESFLLNLACSEKIEELNYIAATVARLGQKCSDSGLRKFDQTFSKLKEGITGNEKPEKYNSANAEKMIEKMDRYISSTSNLHSALETLAQLELSEKKINQWKQNVDRKLNITTDCSNWEEKLGVQRKEVKQYKEISLWSKSYDRVVGLMTRITSTVLIRICDLFGVFVPTLPRFTKNNNSAARNGSNQKHRIHPDSENPNIADKYKAFKQYISKSGPIAKGSKKLIPKFHSQELGKRRISPLGNDKKPKLLQLAKPSTVGGSGLGMRYANIITLAELYLNAPLSISDETRGYIYGMLPERLRTKIGEKLRRRLTEGNNKEDRALAVGWREALEGILGWLGPMARDTMQWQTERNLEKQRFDTIPAVVLLQTLHFSDLEKTEAAIVDVMVGLSCIYKYENRRLKSPRGDDGYGRLSGLVCV